MKIMFTSFPYLGHFLPVVPLAWAARAAGHDVLIATTGQAMKASGRAGLLTVDVSPDFDKKVTTPKREGRSLASMRNTFSSENVSSAANWMTGVNDCMADRTVQVARKWGPDLIVHTPFDVVGTLAAALLSIPAVVHGFGIASMSKLSALIEPIRENMLPICERNGLKGELVRPAAIIDVCPPSLRETDRPSAWFAGYVPYNGGAELPDWILEPRSRPRICVTFGTVVPNVLGVSGLSGIIEAVRDLDAEVILALGETNSSTLGDLPPNVRVVGWIPLSALLPTCSAIIHHGGSGTTMNAIVEGIPQLIMPYVADQSINATTIEQRGMGLACLPEEADAAIVRTSLNQLLEDPGFREKSQMVKKENEEQTPPAGIVPRLAELAGRV